MEHLLERTVRLDRNPHSESTRTWLLHEYDSDGKKIDADYVEWDWDIFFHATELKYERTIKQPTRSPKDTPAQALVPVTETEQIRGVLTPGFFGADKWEIPHYSMFGTGRRISTFSFGVNKILDASEERCTTNGIVAYTTTDGYEPVERDDMLEVQVWLHPSRFDSLATAVLYQHLESLILSVATPGIYTELVPFELSDGFKVLASERAQKIERPDDCDLATPYVGLAHGFSLVTQKRTTLRPVPGINDDGDPAPAVRERQRPAENGQILQKIWFALIAIAVLQVLALLSD